MKASRASEDLSEALVLVGCRGPQPPKSTFLAGHDRRSWLEVMVAENVVVAVGTEGACVAAGHLGHDGLALRRAGQAEDGAGKLEGLLHGPDALVLVGRENLRGIAYCHPIDRHRSSGRHGRIHV